MKKLAGNDLIILMKTALSNDAVLKEAQSLTKDDFNNEDIVVNCFFNAFPQGFSSFDKHASKSVETIEAVKKEVINQGLRKAFNNLQNIRNASNSAVKAESSISGTPEPGFETQLKTAKLVSFLSKYADGENNRSALCDAVSDLNRSDFDSASNKIRSIFARLNPDSNIKTAFVTIKQQIGEGYLMCPKGIYQSGKPNPMAVSDCREYCIDSRVHPDGTVSCNYLKWLNENLITQEQAKNLFDTMDYGSEYETMNLDKGQRTKFPMSDQDSQDVRILRDKNVLLDSMKPWEEKLETQHGQPKKKPEGKAIASGKALEILLQDVRDVFEEDELDTLESMLQKELGG